MVLVSPAAAGALIKPCLEKKKKRKKRSTLALTLFQQPHTAVKNIEVIMEGKGDRELS